MNYRAGMSPDGATWLVEQSPDGIHAQVIATRLPSAKSARAFIERIEADAVPRPAADVAPPASAAAPGIGPVDQPHWGRLP